jgi:hypothetical protein
VTDPPPDPMETVTDTGLFDAPDSDEEFADANGDDEALGKAPCAASSNPGQGVVPSSPRITKEKTVTPPLCNRPANSTRKTDMTLKLAAG